MSAPGRGTGWDRREPWTLHFCDAELERAYKQDQLPASRRDFRVSCLVATLLWLGVAVLGPTFLDVPAGTVLPLALGMAALMLLSFAAVSWATTAFRREILAVAAQLATGLAVIVLTVEVGLFETYAMPGLMLNAMFGFTFQRHPFPYAVTIGAFDTAAFLLAGLWLGVGASLLFQLFLLGSFMAVACAGTYVLEDAMRARFADRTLIADLHGRIDRLFRQYTSPEVARMLVERPDRADLGGEVAEVSVLFADLRGYTSYAEGKAPDEVVAMLNEAYRSAVPAVFDEGGTIVQFMGDALMAIFNAPVRQEDHALRAARAGLALQRAMGSSGDDDPRPRFRVGINTGPALVGNVGSDEIRNFSALGDTTNVAARLKTFAEAGSVVIGERTFELIRDHATVRPLGTPDLKGRSAPTEV
ncbi:MAG: adenylate/guanylate cyclase domain-containing protein [Chloroflexota bacterium]